MTFLACQSKLIKHSKTKPISAYCLPSWLLANHISLWKGRLQGSLWTGPLRHVHHIPFATATSISSGQCMCGQTSYTYEKRTVMTKVGMIATHTAINLARPFRTPCSAVVLSECIMTFRPLNFSPKVERPSAIDSNSREAI